MSEIYKRFEANGTSKALVLRGKLSGSIKFINGATGTVALERRFKDITLDDGAPFDEPAYSQIISKTGTFEIEDEAGTDAEYRFVLADFNANGSGYITALLRQG